MYHVTRFIVRIGKKLTKKKAKKKKKHHVLLFINSNNNDIYSDERISTSDCAI